MCGPWPDMLPVTVWPGRLDPLEACSRAALLSRPYVSQVVRLRRTRGPQHSRRVGLGVCSPKLTPHKSGLQL